MGIFSNFLSGLTNAFRGDRACKITLHCQGDSVTFPIAPESFSVGNTYNNSTLNISNLGEINMRGKRGLATIKFSSFFPYDGSIYGRMVHKPYTLVDKIKAFAESPEPCQIALSGTRVSMYVTIESFEYSEKDSSNDVYFDISFKEYRYIMKDSQEANPVTGLISRVTNSPEMNVLTAVSGIDLMDLSSNLTTQLTSIAEQGDMVVDVYKTLVKSGGVAVGDKVAVSKDNITVNGNKVS